MCPVLQRLPGQGTSQELSDILNLGRLQIQNQNSGDVLQGVKTQSNKLTGRKVKKSPF